MYLVATLVTLNFIHIAGDTKKKRWFDRMFALLFEDILTLKLLNGYYN